MPGVRKELPYEESGKVIKGKLYLLDHKSRIHGTKGKYESTFCGKRFARTDEYTKHTDAHTGIKRYKCKFCEKFFISFFNTENTCNHCQKRFSRKDSLITHIRLHTGEEPFNCTVCHKSFNDGSSLRRHKKSHIPKEEKNETFSCHDCGGNFKSYQILYRHKLKEHSNELFKCNICDYVSKIKGDITVHNRQMHMEAKMVNCKDCNKSYKTNYINTHIKFVHSKKEDYNCKTCDYKTNSKQGLVRHMLFHNCEEIPM